MLYRPPLRPEAIDEVSVLHVLDSGFRVTWFLGLSVGCDMVGWSRVCIGHACRSFGPARSTKGRQARSKAWVAIGDSERERQPFVHPIGLSGSFLAGPTVICRPFKLHALPQLSTSKLARSTLTPSFDHCRQRNGCKCLYELETDRKTAVSQST